MCEYAIVLTKFSVVALVALVLYCGHASSTIESKITAMQTYSIDPFDYEVMKND